MATHYSILAWRNPWTEESGGLPSTGFQRVRHDWSDLAAAVKAMVFPVVMYGCESWTIKHWRIDAFELWCWRRLLRVPSTTEIQPVHPKGDQSWIFIGRTNVETETPILWSLDAKSWLIRKDPDVGKDWGQEEKGMTENEMVGWYHQLNGHGFGWTLGVGDGQGGLAFCGPWVTKSRIWLNDWNELNWTELVWFLYIKLTPWTYVMK